MAKKVLTQSICDSCIEHFMFRLSSEEILILQCLKINKTGNPHTAINETKIIPAVKGLTKFKFQASTKVLHAMDLVGRNSNVKPHSFYITDNGRRLLTLYTRSLKADSIS